MIAASGEPALAESKAGKALKEAYADLDRAVLARCAVLTEAEIGTLVVEDKKTAGINGCSATNLRKFRQFYLTYPEIQQTPSAESSGRTGIRPTLSVESPVTPAAPGPAGALHAAGRFTLGWSHYVTLPALDNAEARRFYEIEATVNGWNVRERGSGANCVGRLPDEKRTAPR